MGDNSKLKLSEFVEYYKSNPDLYIEDIIGIKLLPYQKLMLKTTGIKNQIYFGRHNERDFYRKFWALNSLLLLDPAENIRIYTKDGIKEISRDEAIEMVYKQLYK